MKSKGTKPDSAKVRSAPGSPPYSRTEHRSRTVRDPIHGDINLDPVQAAVVDTLVFQRLRYIRQNGLLHFVFPGAVHTRFAHSLGTMAVASRVWDRLLTRVPAKLRQQFYESISYVGAVFQLAALLHDVGHCAFSHSIEDVRMGNKPLLGSVEELFAAWGEAEFSREYLAAYPDEKSSDAQHEQIGLILVRRIFNEPSVGDACKAVFHIDGPAMGRDVRAILADGLNSSSHLSTHLGKLAAMFAKLGESWALCQGLDKKTFPYDLRKILHVLISGTLDVDRLDYLVRDSTFIGAPYGACDVRILVNALDIGVVGGRVELLLDVKAIFALEDMLWSRYQMFMQIYNHKTNVAFNKMLAQAIPDALRDARIDRPTDFDRYIEFTDDLVMSRVFSLCVRGENLSKTIYGKTLAFRQIPLHLGCDVLKDAKEDQKQEVAKLAKDRAKLAGLMEKDLIAATTTSELIKAGPLPNLVVWDKPSGFHFEAFTDRSSLFAGKESPRAYRSVHFYIDRKHHLS